MWKVFFTAEAEKDIKDQYKKGLLTEEDREVIATWIKQIQEFGPDSLRRGTNFWHDHDLIDNWSGYKSSAFSYRGRIIYKVENKNIIVVVAKVTTEHNYKK